VKFLHRIFFAILVHPENPYYALNGASAIGAGKKIRFKDEPNQEDCVKQAKRLITSRYLLLGPAGAIKPESSL